MNPIPPIKRRPGLSDQQFAEIEANYLERLNKAFETWASQMEASGRNPRPELFKSAEADEIRRARHAAGERARYYTNQTKEVERSRAKRAKASGKATFAKVSEKPIQAPKKKTPPPPPPKKGRGGAAAKPAKPVWAYIEGGGPEELFVGPYFAVLPQARQTWRIAEPLAKAVGKGISIQVGSRPPVKTWLEAVSEINEQFEQDTLAGDSSLGYVLTGEENETEVKLKVSNIGSIGGAAYGDAFDGDDFTEME